MPRGVQQEKKTLFRGVLVLLPAALFTKCVGLFYKIPLLFIVGVEGMAYFLAAYHVYAVLFVLCSTGLPTALSLAVARSIAEGKDARRVLHVALSVFLPLGALGALLLYLFAAPLSRALSITGAEHAIRAIAPALFFSAFCGAAKGYFQGHCRMGTSALAEVTESACKLCLGLLFAFLAGRAGYDAPRVAAAAILGITAGLALSAFVLLVALLLAREEGKRQHQRAREILRELSRVALPITLGACVMSVVSLLDTALISGRLIAAGVPTDTAHAMYSSFGNLAVPLYNLVPSLLSPITLSLMPLIGAASAPHVARSAWRSAVRIVTLLAIPAAMGIAMLATPLLTLLFAGQSAAIAIASPLLCVLGLAVLPAGLTALMGAALQATGRPMVPVLATLAGALVKLVSEYVLLGNARVLLLGAPISTLLCMITILMIEWIALRGALGTVPVLPRELWRPFLSALPALMLGMGVHLAGVYYGLSRFFTLFVVALVAAVYLPLSLRLGAVQREDIEAMPMGERIVVFLTACKLIKGSEINDDTREKASHSRKEGVQRG